MARCKALDYVGAEKRFALAVEADPTNAEAEQHLRLLGILLGRTSQCGWGDPVLGIDDRDTLVEGIRIARRIAAHPPLDRLITAEHAPGPDVGDDYEAILEWARETATTIYHPSGTCKMGRDELAVVDERLRVRGIEGLRVADASIFPRVTGGNTNAPCIMIGEKAADLIRGVRV